MGVSDRIGRSVRVRGCRPTPRANAEVYALQSGDVVFPGVCGVAKTGLLMAGRTGGRGGDTCGRAARWDVQFSKEEGRM